MHFEYIIGVLETSIESTKQNDYLSTYYFRQTVVENSHEDFDSACFLFAGFLDPIKAAAI